MYRGWSVYKCVHVHVLHVRTCQGEIVLHPGDEGQKPETAVLGFAPSFFWHCALDFSTMYIHVHAHLFTAKQHVATCTCTYLYHKTDHGNGRHHGNHSPLDFPGPVLSRSHLETDFLRTLRVTVWLRTSIPEHHHCPIPIPLFQSLHDGVSWSCSHTAILVPVGQVAWVPYPRLDHVSGGMGEWEFFCVKHKIFLGFNENT